MIRRMTRSRLVIAAILMVVLSSIGVAGRPEPPGPPPGPTGTTPVYQVDIPLTIASPGSYVLKENIIGIVGSDGIVIDAPDVTLDLNGFTLTGVSGSFNGVFVGGASGPYHKNVAVKNGAVRGWGDSGLNMAGALSSLLINVRVMDNANDGIIVGPDSNIIDSVATGNGATGIRAVSGLARVSGCVASNNAAYGIHIADPSLISDTMVANNDGGGVLISSQGIIRDSLIWGNAGDGIFVNTGTVQNCEVGGSDTGIRTLGNGSRIEGNVLSGNGVGILVADAGNVIIRNTVRQSGTAGYQIAGGNLLGAIVSDSATLNLASTNADANLCFESGC